MPPGNRSKASAPPRNRVSVQGFEPALKVRNLLSNQEFIMSGSNPPYWFAQSLYTQGSNYPNPYAGRR